MVFSTPPRYAATWTKCSIWAIVKPNPETKTIKIICFLNINLLEYRCLNRKKKGTTKKAFKNAISKVRQPCKKPKKDKIAKLLITLDR